MPAARSAWIETAVVACHRLNRTPFASLTRCASGTAPRVTRGESASILREVSLEIDHVTKRFGTTVALDGLAFEVARGEVFGFLGANGAGKTTTMRICLGIIRADAGEIRWDGRPTEDVPRRTWGYLPEERGLYPRMGVLDQLVYYGSLYGMAPDVARREALGWLTRFRIPEYADRRAEELSKGNQQKVQFIAAVLHDPEVLLMDEPFTGLDPVNLVLLREAFTELRDRGRTLIFSTHQMEAAEALCESVAIVDHGRLVAGGPGARPQAGQRPSNARDSPSTGSSAPTGSPTCRVSSGSGRTMAGSPSSSCPARTRRRSLRRSSTRGAVGAPFRGRRTDPRGALHRACRPSVRRGLDARARCRGGVAVDRRGRLMARSDPLLPNAGIVARREYRDRTRSPLFLGSTVLLAILAMMVAVAPIAIRYLDRQTVTRIGVVVGGRRARPAIGGHRRPAAQRAAGWRRRSGLGAAVRRRGRRPARTGRWPCSAAGDIGGFLVVEPTADGQVDIATGRSKGRTAPAARS